MVAEAFVVHPSDNRGLRPDHEVALYEQIGRLIVAETDFYPISYRSDYAGVDYEAVMYDGRVLGRCQNRAAGGHGGVLQHVGGESQGTAGGGGVNRVEGNVLHA